MQSPKPKTATELNLMVGSPPSPEKRITLQNWYVGEPVRWSFKHIEQLLPCAHAHRGSGPATLLSSGRQSDLSSISFADHTGGTITVGQLLDQTYTDGLLVVHHGKVVFEMYNDMRPTQRHLLQSVSKSLTACLAAVLESHGILDFTRTVAEYLPEFSASAYGDATLQQLLDMSVSVQYDETYDDMTSDVNKHTIAGGWYGTVPRTGQFAGIPESLYTYLPTLTAKQSYPHADRFHYVSANTDVLGIVIERATGRRFTDLFAELIWQPLGPEEDAIMTLDPWGCAFPCGGFAVTLRDLARFGNMMLNDGQVNGRQVVPSGFVRETRYGGDTAAFLRGDGADLGYPNGAYHNQFWITGNDHGAYFCVGIHGQYCYIDPAADMVIAKLSTHPIAYVLDNSRRTLAAFHAIAQHLVN